MKSVEHSEKGKKSISKLSSRLSSESGERLDNDRLEIPQWNRAMYGIKDKKQVDHPLEHKQTKGRSYY